MPGPGTSKEDKRRKRRSLPYEKKPQADIARLRSKFLKARTTPGSITTKADIKYARKIITASSKAELKALGSILGLAGKGIVRILNKRKKKNPHK
jgi:hypothetical protein